MYKRILVPTDGSPLSKKAVRGAIDLAAALGTELVVLHVVPTYPVSYFEGAIAMSPAEIARTEQAWVDKGMALAEAACKQAGNAGVVAKPAVVKSTLVAEAILSAARKHKCDLLVMASHGRKGVKRILLGSETQHVLTHSDLPVLVLR